MKEREIEKKYNIILTYEFKSFLKKHNYPFTETVMGAIVIDDSIVDRCVKEYMEYQQLLRHQRTIVDKEGLQRIEEEKRKNLDEEAKKRKAMSEMLITSGFSFDGYTITKYSGYISGDDAISVDRGWAFLGTGTNVKDKLMDSLVTIRRNALRELKEAAYNLGCNAVIGVDFDYLTLDPQTANITGGTTYQPYVFGVTANGNAVIIEKNKKEEQL